MRRTPRIAQILQATVRTSYTADQAPFLDYSCAEGRLHVDADRAILDVPASSANTS